MKLLHLLICAATVGSYSVIAKAQTRTPNGLINVPSSYDIATTADRFETLLNNRGLIVFHRINHTENAVMVGQTLSPIELIIFGNPEVGTKLINCQQTAAIDLPQKALFWTDKNGKSWISYNNPAYLRDRHNLRGCERAIAKISQVLRNLARKAGE